MAVIEGADPKTNTDLSGIDGFAMHIFQIQAIKPFPEVKQAQRKNLLPDTFNCRHGLWRPNHCSFPGCKCMGRMLIFRMCTQEEESHNTTTRMRIRTVIWCNGLHQKLPGKTGMRICEQGNFMLLFISTEVYFKQGYAKSLHYFSSQFFFLIKTGLRDLNIDQWLRLHFAQV